MPSRPRGAQPGNLNAIRHGFYSRCLRPIEIKDLDDINPKETADEIALIRVVIRRSMELADGVNTLGEMLDLLNAISLSAERLSGIIYRQSLIAGSTNAQISDGLSAALAQLRKERYIK